jgi:hypothetical protein
VTIRRSRLSALAAAVAVLMHLCWPFAGQLRAAPAQEVQVICTVHGVMTVPIDETPQSGTATPACVMCSAASVAISIALPAAAASDSPASAGPEVASVATLRRLLHSPSRPRAPPAFS